ncbi:MAG: DUF1801 domain-containing protein [Planctomycetes bacterium]|nr:DUF1801 domain-containing protein [Planctomycetota bacterium]
MTSEHDDEPARKARKVPARACRSPRLLSGGNPQIPKADGDAPVRAYLAAMPGWKRGVGEWLDALIERAVPGVQKAVKWNSPLYGVDGRSWFCSMHCFANHVKLTFFRGGALEPPPHGVGKNEDVRWFDVREHDARDDALVAAWIRQAAALPGWLP